MDADGCHLTGTAVYRVSETDSTYNTTITSPLFGQETEEYKHTVPVNAAFDECTSNTYAQANTTANIVGLTAEAESDSVACGGFTEGTHSSAPGSVNTLTQPAASRPAQVISDERTFYDDPTFSTTFPQTAAPAKGDVTMTQTATDATGSLTYQTMTRSTYDSLGRPVTTFDANGNKSTIAYTANSAGLNVGVTTTNPLGQTSSTTLDPERALTLVSKDLNGDHDDRAIRRPRPDDVGMDAIASNIDAGQSNVQLPDQLWCGPHHRGDHQDAARQRALRHLDDDLRRFVAGSTDPGHDRSGRPDRQRHVLRLARLGLRHVQQLVGPRDDAEHVVGLAFGVESGGRRIRLRLLHLRRARAATVGRVEAGRRGQVDEFDDLQRRSDYDHPAHRRHHRDDEERRARTQR